MYVAKAAGSVATRGNYRITTHWVSFPQSWGWWDCRNQQAPAKFWKYPAEEIQPPPWLDRRLRPCSSCWPVGRELTCHIQRALLAFLSLINTEFNTSIKCHSHISASIKELSWLYLPRSRKVTQQDSSSLLLWVHCATSVSCRMSLLLWQWLSSLGQGQCASCYGVS